VDHAAFWVEAEPVLVPPETAPPRLKPEVRWVEAAPPTVVALLPKKVPT
jgi:hypothetical protein